MLFHLSPHPPRATLFPYTTLFRSIIDTGAVGLHIKTDIIELLNLERMDGTFTVHPIHGRQPIDIFEIAVDIQGDRKSTRLNSSHLVISYAVFCLKKKKIQ